MPRLAFAAPLLAGALFVLPASAADKDPPRPVIQVQFLDDKVDLPGLPLMPRGKDSMRFGLIVLNEKDAKGDPKRLTYDPYGRTNNTVLRVDGQDFIFGDTLDQDSAVQGEWVERAGKLDADADGRTPQGARSVWKLKKTPMVVTQFVEVVKGPSGRLDTCLIRYRLENSDKAEHKVGLRFLLDTFIGGNDGVPFVIPGDPSLCDTRMEFHSPRLRNVPDYIYAVEREDRKDRGTVARVSFRLSKALEAPSRVQLSGWPDKGLRDLYNLFGDRRTDPEVRDRLQAGDLLEVWEELKGAQEQYTLWDVPHIKFSALAETRIKKKTEKEGGETFPPDSAVVLYWDPQPLKPGAKREVGFAYGLGEVIDDEGKGRLMLTVGGSLVPDGEFTLTALVSGPTAKEKVSIDVPEGLSLVKSDAEQLAPRVGKGRLVSAVAWKLKADKEGTYTVTVRSSEGAAQRLKVEIKKAKPLSD